MTGGSGEPDLAASAAATLMRWDPPDEAQAELRDSFVRHVRSHPGAVHRTGPPVHLTASCLVLDEDARHVLLTLHAKARRWFQLGGHLEPGDASLHAGATREAREESGVADLTPRPEVVHLDRHDLPSAFGGCRTHLDVRFVALTGRDRRPEATDESLQVRWWPVDALPPGAGDDLGPLLRAALATLA